MPVSYMPILKTKAGEARALRELSPLEKDRIQPLFQIGESIPTTFAAKMHEAWHGRVVGLDGSFNFNLTGTGASYDVLFNTLGGLGVAVIPSMSINAHPLYRTAIAAKVGTFAPAVVVRTNLLSLSSAIAFAQFHSWHPNNVDLVIEVGNVADHDPAFIASYVAQQVNTHVPPGAWRTVALSSSAAPKDFSALNQGTNIVPRNDFRMFRAAMPQIQVPLAFSDYGISHSDLTEPPPFVMGNATVSVRYAAPDHWIMIKGRPVSGPNGIAMGTQYRAHAQTLLARPEFPLTTPSWANDRVTAIATIAGQSAGGRSQWVEIGANRHFGVSLRHLP